MDKNFAAALDRKLKTLGVPILGVSIKDPDNVSTWRIDYAPEATAQQRTYGDSLIAAFDKDAVPVALVPLALDDLVRYLAGQAGQTVDQFTAAIRAVKPTEVVKRTRAAASRATKRRATVTTHEPIGRHK